MSTLTGIDISSAALVKIGSNPIQSFNDNTKEAQVAAVLYPRVSASELASYPWSFAGNKVELNQLVETPIDPNWAYAYQLPTDLLALRSCFDDSGITAIYYVEGTIAYSNSTRLFAEYTSAVAESAWPEYFVDLVIARLAWEFATAVTGIETDAERSIKEYQFKLKRARNVDANANQPQVLIDPANSSLVRARFGWWGQR